MTTGALLLLPLFAIGLAVPLALTPLFRGLVDCRMRDRAALALIGSAVLAGYMGGGALVWRLVPSGWHLSFWQTMAASVDAEKYGHTVEHYAECVVIMILCACMAGAAISGVLAAATARLLNRPRHA